MNYLSIRAPALIGANGGPLDPLAGINFSRIRLQFCRGFGPTPYAVIGLYKDVECTIPATEAGDLIAAAMDELGTSGVVLTQSTEANRPALQFVSGRPVIRFGTNKYLAGSNIINGSGPRTMVVAYKHNAANTDSFVYTVVGQSSTGTNGTWFTIQARTLGPDGDPYAACYVEDLGENQGAINNLWKTASLDYDGTTAHLRMNNRLLDSGPRALDTDNEDFYLGCSFSGAGLGEFLNGDVSSVLISPTVLSSEDRATVVNFCVNTLSPTNPTEETLEDSTSALFAINEITFTDLTTAYKAAPAYGFYVPDNHVAMRARPDKYPSSISGNIVDKTWTARDGSDNFPLGINADETPLNYSSGCLVSPSYKTVDGLMGLIAFHQLYHSQTASLTKFNAQKSVLKTKMLAIPRDGIYVDCTGWLPWGFQDGLLSTGKQLFGTLWYWNAATMLAALYTAAGDTSDATLFQDEADDIQAELQDTSKPLWSVTNGMFLAASGDNNQVDNFGSSLAVALGVASSAQASAISDFLHANFAAIVDWRGYIRMGVENWDHSTFLNDDNQCGNGTGEYDDMFWSHLTNEVCIAMAVNHPADAVEVCLRHVLYETDLAREYIGTTKQGFPSNLVSGVGAYAFVRDNPGLFT